MTPAIRVLVVDDHALHRDGTRQILAGDADIEVVGDADTGEMALTLAARLSPDVVLMDIRLPGMSGIETTRRLRQTHPAIRVLMVSAYDDDEYVRGALQAGASGHLSKAAPGRELAEAIRLVAQGRSVVAQDILGRLIASHAAVPGANPGLSVREQAVLDLLAQGLPNREIASLLHISSRTVERHCENVYVKLA
ncbi:MAG: DNA-binding response regulator, partial [Microbacterium sp. 14-71-5]